VELDEGENEGASAVGDDVGKRQWRREKERGHGARCERRKRERKGREGGGKGSHRADTSLWLCQATLLHIGSVPSLSRGPYISLSLIDATQLVSPLVSISLSLFSVRSPRGTRSFSLSVAATLPLVSWFLSARARSFNTLRERER